MMSMVAPEGKMRAIGAVTASVVAAVLGFGLVSGAASAVTKPTVGGGDSGSGGGTSAGTGSSTSTGSGTSSTTGTTGTGTTGTGTTGTGTGAGTTETGTGTGTGVGTPTTVPDTGLFTADGEFASTEGALALLAILAVLGGGVAALKLRGNVHHVGFDRK